MRDAIANPPDVRARYEAVIGLEVHVQLLTRSKIFCACSTRFGDPPNSNTCPVCLGLPGALPVLNRDAVTMAMKAALALNCTVHPRSRFARKNYFYPDLPKGYQISQYDEPLASGGWLDIEADGKRKRIGVTRVHLEEDAGKSLHEGFPDSDRKSYIDLNRSGVPLIEIVSEPDLRSPEEAYDYLTRLKTLLLYLEVSDCNMEEGSLRCDANVSVRQAGVTDLGTKTEVKNLNSFKFLQKALEHEIERQIAVLDGGGEILQETRLWDSREQRTVGMRSKEFAHDYRYFPEPDLLPLAISDQWIEEVRRAMPELPEAKKARFVREYGNSPANISLLVASKAQADLFEAVVREGVSAAAASNWILNELQYLARARNKAISEATIPASHLAELLKRIEHSNRGVAQALDKEAKKAADVSDQMTQKVNEATDLMSSVAKKAAQISATMAKEILPVMLDRGMTVDEVIADKGLAQISDAEQITAAVREIMAANPKQVEQYQSGKTATLGWFVGQVMKKTRGQANPQLVQDALKKELGAP